MPAAEEKDQRSDHQAQQDDEQKTVLIGCDGGLLHQVAVEQSHGDKKEQVGLELVLEGHLCGEVVG